MELRRRLGAAGLVVAVLWLLALWSFHVSHHASLTAPASALLRSRRASSLGPADAASLDSIPRIIHQTWKTKSLPQWAIEPVASWKRLNPTWRHILHDDDDMDRIVRASYPAIWPAYSTVMKPIQKVCAVCIVCTVCAVRESPVLISTRSSLCQVGRLPVRRGARAGRRVRRHRRDCLHPGGRVGANGWGIPTCH